MSAKGITSHLVHFERRATPESGAVHTPIFNSVPYGYAKAQDLVDVFQGKQAGQAYARQSTPTTDVLQEHVTALEGGIGSLVFGSGMAAISAVFLTLLKSGDHIVASQYLFGNTSSVFATLQGFGIEVTQVDVTDANEVAAACRENTRMVFTETIANPGTQVADLKGIGQVCRERDLLYVVDGTMTSAVLLPPKEVGAHLVVNALSKYFGGHGAALGGTVTDTGLFNWESYPNIFPAYRTGESKGWGLLQIKKKGLRDMGGCISSEGAHQLMVGAETMALRLERQCANAQALAELLEAHPKVAKVYYPGLESHPQYRRTQELFSSAGAILSLELVDGLDCCEFLDNLDLVINATHLGDNRTLALPVALTIYYEMGAEARAAAGIADSMVRCSIGIEDTADLLADFTQALDKLA